MVFERLLLGTHHDENDLKTCRLSLSSDINVRHRQGQSAHFLRQARGRAFSHHDSRGYTVISSTTSMYTYESSVIQASIPIDSHVFHRPLSKNMHRMFW